MRPKKKGPYTLSAANVAGFMTTAVLTGAGPTFNTIAGAPSDGLGHLLSVTSAANIATIVFTIIGTDANGNVISTTITGVNANTVNASSTTGNIYFKTVTSVSISATLGANTASVGWTAVAATPAIPVDFAKLTGPMVNVCINGTTITWTAQQINSDIFKEITTNDWATIGTASSTTNIAAQALAGATAVRTLVVSHTNGILEMIVSQARV